MVSGGVFFQRESAMPQPSISKSMTSGESGLAALFVVTALLCLTPLNGRIPFVSFLPPAGFLSPQPVH